MAGLDALRLKVPQPQVRGAGAPHERAWGARAIVDRPVNVGNLGNVETTGAGTGAPVLASLLFAPGYRPDARAIEALALTGGSLTGGSSAGGDFSISHRPDAGPEGEEPGWLELITTGLTFDLRGLAPGRGGDRFAFAHRYGLGGAPDSDTAETMTLALGPHLAGAGGLLPVVRAAARLSLALAALPGAVAVGWHPARVLSGTGHFASSVGGWLAGGVFPALGLTALTRSPDGAMTSEGLFLLIGQELWLEPAGVASPADDARLAVRLIDRLVGIGPLRTGVTTEPVPGHPVSLEPDQGARLIRARRL